MTLEGDGINIQLFPAELNALLSGPNGPVARKMIVDAEKVRQEAKRLVGVSDRHPAPGARGVQRRPGTLRDSIVKRPARTPDGELGYYVGTSDPVALFHHEGTPPHLIRARRAPMLVFYWKRKGQVVAFKQVHHPGTKPNRFLLDALKVLRRLG